MEKPMGQANQLDTDKKYDLEERTYLFAKEIRSFIKHTPRTISNIEDLKQLARSSGSVGANYIEANGALGKDDFLMKIRTCRKEARESRFWLRLIDIGENEHLAKQCQRLVKEAEELGFIFGAILGKNQKKQF